jgi:hypothetical protein
LKLPHVLWVREPAVVFLPLFEAVRAAGLRAGWLELAAPPSVEPLDRLTAAGALRAVAVGEGRLLALKRQRGRPVLGDLVRELFLGCAAVLVQGDPATAAALVQPLPPPARADEPAWWRLLPGAGEPWTLEPASGDARHLELDALVARLRRPRLG